MMVQQEGLTKQDLEEAAKAAKEAAEAAELAATTAAENAQLANQSAEAALQSAQSAGSISDIITNASSSFGGPSDFIYLLAIFALAIFVGYYVVWSVTPALHTPLMAVTNAVSSVVIVGALIALGASGGANLVGAEAGGTSKFLGFLAVVLASVNIFGGFTVTQRMLVMYKKKER